jgi:hypothetical protein
MFKKTVLHLENVRHFKKKYFLKNLFKIDYKPFKTYRNIIIRLYNNF